MTIRTRIALFGAGVVAITVLIFGVLLYILIAIGLASQQNQILVARGQQASTFVRLASPQELAAGKPLVPIDLKTSPDTFVEVLDADGGVLSSGVR
jgi:hypothetical protein